jgi:hypothetical protein
MSKSFLYTGAKTVDAFGCGEPHCPICTPSPYDAPPPSRYRVIDGIVLRTNDTEKRLTEGEDDDD